jgi:hypothetical protein
LDINKHNWALNDFLLSNYSSGIPLDELLKINQGNLYGSKISTKLFTIYLNETLRKIKRTLDDNLEMISAYADDIVIIVKHRGNFKRVIKKVEREFGKLNLKLNKKKCGIMRINEKSS